MKYRVENRLDLFEFHDAELSFTDYRYNQLILSAKHLNIHKGVPENPHNSDMELDLAVMSFTGFEVLSWEPMRNYQIYDTGNWFTEEPQIIYKGKEAESRFWNSIRKGFSVNCVDICTMDNKTCINLSISTPAYSFVTLTFENVAVEWDTYYGKAWYELHKQFMRKGYLLTPSGEQETEIHIVYHEEPPESSGAPQGSFTISIGVKYGGKELWGCGKEYLWEDAFAKVQKQLPEGVFLKCCMTCRHGNMCPYGNKPGEIFCTKGFIIRSKDDMCNWFDSCEIDKAPERTKNVADSCKDFQPQDKDYYTYSDYLYYRTLLSD